VDRGEPGGAGDDAVSAGGLQVSEERADRRRVESVKSCWLGCLPRCWQVKASSSRIVSR
jgi:hypothetical protein